MGGITARLALLSAPEAAPTKGVERFVTFYFGSAIFILT